MSKNRTAILSVGTGVVGLLLLALLATTQAFGQVRIQTPRLSGDGCTGAATASATLAPDGSALSVLFDNFVARAGTGTSVRMKRTSCVMEIPVTVPAKTQVAITRADTRGYNSLPLRGYAQYTTQYSIAGRLLPVIMARFSGPVNTDYTMANRLKQTDVQWSPCGASTQVSINTSVVVQTNEKNDVVLSSIDSSDIQSGGGTAIKFALQYRSCK